MEGNKESNYTGNTKTETSNGFKISPRYEKKKGVNGCLTAIAVVVLIGVVGSFAGGKGDDNDDSFKKITESTSETRDNNEVEAQTETEAETEAIKNNIFYAGDVLETKNIRLSYLSCGDYSDSNMFVKAEDGNKLIYFEFEFENIGNSDASVGSFDFDCYADGYEVSQEYAVTSKDAMTSITTLSPGRKLKGIVVFEVPQDANDIEVEYETNFWSEDKVVFVFQTQ